MKPRLKKLKTINLVLACSIIAITAMSFKNVSKEKHFVLPELRIDTPKKDVVHIDIDIKDLNKALEDVNIELKGINWDKVSKDIEVSLNSINIDEIKSEVTQSLQSVDWEKIKREVNNSVKNINLDELKINVKKATDKLKSTINSKEFKRNINQLKKVDINKLKREIRKAQKDIDNSKDYTRIEKKKAEDEVLKNTTDATELKKIGETTKQLVPDKNRLFFLI